ncbi:MAG: pseudoazurin, partial [Pseudomonadota bacterium]
FAALLISLPLTLSAALAGEVVGAKMLNKHPENRKFRNVFHPRIIKVKRGDTVNFISVKKGHNTESIKKMIPEGAQNWKSKISKDFEVKFDKPGIYGYRCASHVTLGMVGLIIVEAEGMTENLEAARKLKHRGKAKKVWEEIWQEVDEKGLLKPTT